MLLHKGLTHDPIIRLEYEIASINLRPTRRSTAIFQPGVSGDRSERWQKPQENPKPIIVGGYPVPNLSVWTQFADHRVMCFQGATETRKGTHDVISEAKTSTGAAFLDLATKAPMGFGGEILQEQGVHGAL